MVNTNPSTKPIASTTENRRSKAKKEKKRRALTKEERREKYTKIAHKKRDKRDTLIHNEQTKHTVCFQCRKKGHVASHCPMKVEAKSEEANLIRAPDNVCFHCGSTDHRLYACPQKRKGDINNNRLPFAKCFVCGEMGHISSQCSQNQNGIYVNGGSCRTCGSKDHLASKCPKAKQIDDDDDDDNDCEDAVVYDMDNGDGTSANPEEISEDKADVKKKKRNVVNF